MTAPALLLADVRLRAFELGLDAFPELGALVHKVLPDPLDPMLLLPLAACTQAGGHPEDAVPVAAVLALQGLAYRLLDDLADQDNPRAAPYLLGLPTTVHLAGALQQLATRGLLTLRLPGPVLQALGSRYLQAGLRVHQGQLMDAAPIDSLAAYRRVVDQKTAEAFRFMAAAGALVGGAERATQEALEEAGHRLGWMVQILDDMESFWHPDGPTELSRGHRLLPVWLGLEDATRHRVQPLLEDEPALRRCLTQLGVRQQLFTSALDLRDQALAAFTDAHAHELVRTWTTWCFRDARALAGPLTAPGSPSPVPP